MKSQPDTIEMMPEEVAKTELRNLQAENIKLEKLLEKELVNPCKLKGNYWKAMYFEQLNETRKANKGNRRYAEGKRRRKIADIMLAEEQQKDDAKELEYSGHGLITLHQA